ncbi:MAG: IclR family transcriptional regulator [Phycisphaeraceae bacterium JB051]
MSSQPNKSLIDGLACLQALAMHAEPVACRALARELDLNVMRANRLLRTLADVGLAHQDAKRRYTIGPGIHTLAAQSMFASGLLKRALKPLRKLGKAGQLVALGVLWQNQVTYLYHGQHGCEVEDALGKVTLFPATRSSVGMALLATHTDKDLRAMYRDQAIPGYNNITELLADIRQTRKQGYACIEHHNENKPAHLTVAVTVGQPVTAAIALSGMPTDEPIDDVIKQLQEAATIIAPPPE